MKTFSIERELYSKTMTGRILSAFQGTVLGAAILGLFIFCITNFRSFQYLYFNISSSLNYLNLSYLSICIIYLNICFIIGLLEESFVFIPKSILKEFQSKHRQTIKKSAVKKIKELELEITRCTLTYQGIIKKWSLEKEISLLKEEYS